MLYETSYIRKERIKLNPSEMTEVIPTEDKLRDIIHQVVCLVMNNVLWYS